MSDRMIVQAYVQSQLHNQLTFEKKTRNQSFLQTGLIVCGLTILWYLFGLFIPPLHTTARMTFCTMFTAIPLSCLLVYVDYAIQTKKIKQMLQAIETNTFSYKERTANRIVTYDNTVIAHVSETEYYKIPPKYTGANHARLIIVELCGEILTYVKEIC